MVWLVDCGESTCFSDKPCTEKNPCIHTFMLLKKVEKQIEGVESSEKALPCIVRKISTENKHRIIMWRVQYVWSLIFLLHFHDVVVAKQKKRNL